MSSNYFDFQDAAPQQSGFDLIPKGTVVPVRMTIKPGGHDDPAQGWVGGYATESFETGAIYLAAEFVVTGGEHAKRKMWSNIGLHSKKGPTWGQMGRSFIRAALNSARNVHPQDNSPQAAAARSRWPCSTAARKYSISRSERFMNRSYVLMCFWEYYGEMAILEFRAYPILPAIYPHAEFP